MQELGCGIQGEPVKINLVYLAKNPNTNDFGQVQSKLSIQKHHVTILGLYCCHAQKHGNYNECDHGAVCNTKETNAADHSGIWHTVTKREVNRFALYRVCKAYS